MTTKEKKLNDEWREFFEHRKIKEKRGLLMEHRDVPEIRKKRWEEGLLSDKEFVQKAQDDLMHLRQIKWEEMHGAVLGKDGWEV